jgi:hypothetical protein
MFYRRGGASRAFENGEDPATFAEHLENIADHISTTIASPEQ